MIDPGFERVAEVFAAGAAKQARGGLAFAATVDGRPVVDLVAGEAKPGVPWAHDTRAVVMSVTKGWSLMVLQLLHDRGLFTLDTPVVDIWPEYGAAGKERTLVRHFLEHTGGVLGVPDVGTLVKWDGGGWDDLDAIAARLAAASPAWEPGSRAGYHAVTFGWLVGELVRRLDGRTLGTVFREDIAEPLGIRTAIGVPRAEQGDIADEHTERLLEAGPFPLRLITSKLPAMMRDPKTLIGQAFLGDGTASIMDNVTGLMADPRFLEAEVPASNGVSSAADLARLYALLAGGGELDGVRLISPETVALFLRPDPTPLVDTVMSGWVTTPILKGIVRKAATVARTVGGFEVNQLRKGKVVYGPSPLAIGNGGAGGQFAFADPVNRVSGGFVRTGLGNDNKIHNDLIAALYECVGPRP